MKKFGVVRDDLTPDESLKYDSSDGDDIDILVGVECGEKSAASTNPDDCCPYRESGLTCEECQRRLKQELSTKFGGLNP